MNKRGIAFITYCSGRKNRAPGEIPAIERYESPRLGVAAKAARDASADFFILSGKFGLLEPSTPIPWYDHLLQADEVAAMAEKITPRIGEYSEIVFCMKDGDYVEPYRDVLSIAAGKTGISLRELLLKV